MLPAVVLPVVPVVAWPVVFALEFAAVFCDALEALVCELVAGTPVLVPVLVVPVWAVVVLGAEEADVVLLMSPVAEPVVEAVVLGVVLEVEPAGVVVEAEVLGVVADVLPLTLPVALGVVELPAVVAGPVVEAEVPGAEALVLPVVEAVPVCDAVPEAVVVLPGAVDDALGAVDADALGVVDPVDVVVEPLTPAEVELLLGAAVEADEVLSAAGRLAEPDALQLPIARILWPTCAVRSSLLCSWTSLPAPVCRKNCPLRSSTQPVSFTLLPERSLADAPVLLVVLSVAPVWLDVVELVEACGVFLVSSVRVEPDVLLVELCANMVTEKLNAAANVSSFFMVFRLLVGKQNLPTLMKMRAAGWGDGFPREVSC